MAQTVISNGDGLAIKKYSAILAAETPKMAWFGRKMMGAGEKTQLPVMLLTDLESDSGDTVSFDLNVQLKMQPVEGDDKLAGKEDNLIFYTDELKIQQLRAGVNCGGRMTRKRTKHKLREIARARSTEYWARVFDELIFIYSAGKRGVNTGFVFPTSYTGFGGNSFDTPDTDHLRIANGKTSSTLTDSDVLTLDEIDILSVKAEMMGGGTEETPQIQPIMIDGEEHYVYIAHPWSLHDLKTATGSKWYDLQKALVTAEGKKSPIFTGAAVMHDNVVIQKHKNVIRMYSTSDYTSDGSTATYAARNLFMGRQAVAVAFGMRGTGLRFGWYEEYEDRGNVLVIDTDTILGVSQVQFNSKTFGLIAHDVAAKNPESEVA